MKNFYKEHRIFVILMGIVALCIIIMLIIGLKYFYFGNSKDERNNCPKINNDKTNEISKSLKAEQLVKDITINVNEKSPIVYMTIAFNNGISLVEAQGKAVTVLEKFTKEEKECYDFQFILKQDKTEGNEGFKIMGSANANGTSLTWNNNTQKSETSEK